MKLYIKQKVFSWGDKFTVKDEAGRDRYYAPTIYVSGTCMFGGVEIK